MTPGFFVLAVVASIAPVSPLPSVAPSPTQTAAGSARSHIVSVPPSWHGIAARRGGSKLFSSLGDWESDNGNQSISVVVTSSFGAGLKGITQSITAGMSERDSNMALSEAGTVRLCHGQDGWKQVYLGRGGDGMTYVFGATRARTYIAVYTYQKSSSSLEGEAAAESLCPPPDPVVHLPPPPVEPPTGWTAIAGAETEPLPAGVTDWNWIVDTKSQRQTFIVMRFPLKGRGGISYRYTSMIERLTKGRATVLTRTPIELCHQTDAVYVALQYPALQGLSFAEAVMTVAGKQAYAAFYIRVASDRARSEAERALRSLCPARVSRSLPI